MKNTVTNLLEKVREHYLPCSLCVLAIFAITMALTLSISGYSPFLYGRNLQYYTTLKTYYNDFLTIISTPNLLGTLFTKLLVTISNGNPLPFTLVGIILYLFMVFSLFFAGMKVISKPLCNLLCTTLFALSFPALSSITLIESIPSMISTIFLSWALFFYFSKNIERSKILTYIFLCLYLFASSLSIVLIPLFVLAYLKGERDKKSLIILIVACILSLLLSLSSFTYNKDGRYTYFGYMLSGIINFISIPFAYSGDNMINLEEIAVGQRLIFVLVGFIYSLYCWIVVQTLVFSTIKNIEGKRRRLAFGGLIILSMGLCLVLMGFIRRVSLFNLLTLLLLLNLFAPRVLNDLSEKHKAFLPATTCASFVSSIVLLITLVLSYVQPEINNCKEKMDIINSYTEGNQLHFVGSSSEVNEILYLSHYLNKEDAIIPVDLEKNPSLSQENFDKYEYYSSLTGEEKIEQGINIVGEWNIGYKFDAIFYTTNDNILLEYFSPDYFPKNTLRIYANEKLIKTEKKWNNYSNTNITLPKGGSFVHIRIEADFVFMPNDLDPSNPDKKHLAFYIVSLVAD